MPNPKVSLIKICGIIGFVAGEVYMIFTVASPRLQGVEIPMTSLLTRLVAMSLLFGPFGMAFGTGIGLLLDALTRSEAPPENGHQKESRHQD